MRVRSVIGKGGAQTGVAAEPRVGANVPAAVWAGARRALRIALAATIGRLSLFRQFALLSLVILVVGAYVIGSYVAGEIKNRVLQRTSAITALYVDSAISSHLQELRDAPAISPVHLEHLDALLTTSSLGQKIVSFKVWDRNGRVVYASDRRLVGQTFFPEEGLRDALAGRMHASLSDLGGDENLYERERWGRLVETYAPVHAYGSGEIIGVSEFYQDPKELESEVSASQRKGWLIVGGATAAMYFLLVGIVMGASNTIRSQHGRLETLARENAALAARVRKAAARKAETDERLLSRIGQDLHDGPAQDVSLALLRLDSLGADSVTEKHDESEDFRLVRSALEGALKEMRQISGGLRLPELEGLSLAEVVEKAVTEHREKTGNRVHLSVNSDLPAPRLPLKIAVYRVTREALNNAYRHAGVDEEEVELAVGAGAVRLEVRDRGVGLRGSRRPKGSGQEHSPLGLRGMRERVELLGGNLEVLSEKGAGTTVRATIPVSSGEG